MKEFYEKLNDIQTRLKAPKNLVNKFGNYNYRNAEGICEAVKPLLREHGLVLTLDDEIVQEGDRVYIKSTATITDGAESVRVSALAREADQKKGMDAAQVTGATSSYARKYALNGLLLLDDTKDPDTDEYAAQTKAKPADPKADNVGGDRNAILLVESCKRDNIDVDKLLARVKCGSLSELTPEYINNIYDHWDTVRKECGKEDK